MPTGWAESPRWEVAEPIKVVWKRKGWILAGGLVCALLTYVGCLLLPKRYEAQATVLIRPPRLPDDVKLPQFSAEFLYSVPESDAVKQQVQTESQQKGVLRPGESLTGYLRTETVPPREKGPQARTTVRLIVQADTPEKAAGLANIWTDVFIAQAMHLAVEEKENARNQVHKSYRAAQARMDKLEVERAAADAAYDRRALKRRLDWDAKILDRKKDFERWRKEYSVATEKQRLAFQQRWGLDFPPLAERRPKEDRVTARPADDGLALVGRSAVKSAGPVGGGDLPPQAAPEAKTGATRPGESEDQRRLFYEKSAELYELQKDRELTQHLKTEEQEAQLAALEQTRDSELEAMARQHEHDLKRLESDLIRIQAQFANLAARYEAVNLLQPEDLSDIKIGARALAPQNPIRPRTAVYTIVALGLGLAVSLMLVFVTETLQK